MSPRFLEALLQPLPRAVEACPASATAGTSSKPARISSRSTATGDASSCATLSSSSVRRSCIERGGIVDRRCECCAVRARGATTVALARVARPTTIIAARYATRGGDSRTGADEDALHYLLTYDVVSDYVTRRAPLRAAHIALARAAVARGDLVLGGALGNPPDAVALLFQGDSPAAAEAFARDDPVRPERAGHGAGGCASGRRWWARTPRWRCRRISDTAND